MSASSYYDLLGVPNTADREQIKVAFYKRVKAVHPDTARENDTAEEFHRLRNAFDVLYCETSRRVYDAQAHVTRSQCPGDFQSDTEEETLLTQRQLSRLVMQHQLAEAVTLCVDLGAPIHLIECLLEQCHRTKQFPEAELEQLLDAMIHDLHLAHGAPPPYGIDLTDHAVITYSERKTMAYNRLIRLCNECGKAEHLVVVLDAMSARGIDVLRCIQYEMADLKYRRGE